ncbi:hypothetical protein BDD12DRAFT_803472 [Trichophaea hybrida]|nr:hypothetical protein BDD12DRAFT_803472 [Trichophaea hybrida]
MSADNILTNSSFDSTPSNPSNSTPPSSTSTSTSTISTTAVTSAHHRLDKDLNELPTTHSASNTSSIPAIIPGSHCINMVPGEPSTRCSSSGIPPPSSATSSSPNIFEQPSELSSRITSFSTDRATVVSELEMPASTRFKMDEEKEDDGWDFKCIGLDQDPACPEEGNGGS